MFLRTDKASRGGRFSALLLEEGEQYVSDWAASLEAPPPEAAPVSDANAPRPASLPGTLRLGTASLFFEPRAPAYPILRVPLSAVTEMSPFARAPRSPLDEGAREHGFDLKAALVTLMREGGRDHPYVTRRPADPTSIALSFVMDFAAPEAFLPLIQAHLGAAHLDMDAGARGEKAGAAMVRSMNLARESEFAFDTSRLVSFDEALLLDAPVRHVTPLCKEPGRLVITDQRVYFAPLFTSFGDLAVCSHALAHVAGALTRRIALKDTGLELLFTGLGEGGAPRPQWGEAPDAQALLEFRSREERDAALDTLRGLPATAGALPPGLREGALALLMGAADAEYSLWFARMTAAWMRGALCNLDYLMVVNALAGRTVCDLSQWPVFPWVVADWSSERLDLTNPASFRDLSKPMGALTAERLAYFTARFEQMLSVYKHGLRELPPDQRPSPGRLPPLDPLELPYLYGTHYSTPAYTMYWLVRSAPGHQLRLQNGRFDAPDRCFHSLPQCWHSAATHRADIKELIPEFFLGDGSFLVDNEEIVLGALQDGRPVRGVALPPWAEGSPARFLELHRAALESDHVRAHLSGWLDLIFGAKQNGPGALEAHNVFHPLSYEGALSLDHVEGGAERERLQLQIQEFGQVPRVLFQRDHPAARTEGREGGGEEASAVPSFTDIPSCLLSALARTVAALEGDPAVARIAEELGAADAFHGRAFACPDRMPLISTFVPLSLLWGDDLANEEEELERRKEAKMLAEAAAKAAAPPAPAPSPAPATVGAALTDKTAQAGAALKGLFGKLKQAAGASASPQSPPPPPPPPPPRAQPQPSGASAPANAPGGWKAGTGTLLKGLFGGPKAAGSSWSAASFMSPAPAISLNPPASRPSPGPALPPRPLRPQAEVDAEQSELIEVLQQSYGLHFPELLPLVRDGVTYAELVLTLKDRSTASAGLVSIVQAITGSSETAAAILTAARGSRGAALDPDSLETQEALAHRILALREEGDRRVSTEGDTHRGTSDGPEVSEESERVDMDIVHVGAPQSESQSVPAQHQASESAVFRETASSDSVERAAAVESAVKPENQSVAGSEPGLEPLSAEEDATRPRTPPLGPGPIDVGLAAIDTVTSSSAKKFKGTGGADKARGRKKT